MNRSRFTVFVFYFLTLSFAFADKTDDLVKRVEKIEKQQGDALLLSVDNEARINAFHHNQLTLGGFFESGLTAMSGPDTKAQANTTSAILGLNLSAEFDKHLRFVSQVITGLSIPMLNAHNDPFAGTVGLPSKREFKSFVFGALVAQGYLEYATKREFRIQGGMGYVPFAYSFQLREPVLFVRRGGAQILRTTNLVFPLWSGVHINDEFRSGQSHWGYNAYTFSALANPKVPGLGARAWLRPSTENCTLGLSSQVGKRSDDTYVTLGADMHFKVDALTVTTEYAKQFVENFKTWSAHLEPSYLFGSEQWIVYVFGDYANSDQNMTLTRSDSFKKWEYGGGMNWLPTSFTRIRTGLTFNDYVGDTAVIAGQNRDDISLDISVGAAF